MFHPRRPALALASAAVLALSVGCASTGTDQSAGSLPPSASPSISQQTDEQQSTDDAPADSSAGNESTTDTGASDTGASDTAPSDTALPDTTPSDTAETPAFPVTITAANGDVTIDAQPTAIVSLSPTATEMLYAIGAGDQVVAADQNSTYPDDVPNATIDALQLNIEALTQYEPDLLVSSFISNDQADKFASLDFTALAEPAAVTLDDTYAQITQLGQATGHIEEAADLVTEMKDEIASANDTATALDMDASYYYELEETFYSATSDTFIGHVLSLAGLASIADTADDAADTGGYPQLSAEFVLSADPDYIFLTDTDCCGQTAETVAARPGWDVVDAVNSGRVVELDADIASRWGPRIPQLLTTVVDALKEHPLSS